MRSTLLGLLLGVGVASVAGAQTPAPPKSEAEAALTAPSGVHSTVRAKQCNAQADKKRLERNARQAFYKACLASAAPVTATGSKDHPAVPTPAKPKLENLTAAPQH